MHSDHPSLFCPQQVLSPLHAICADYRLRLGWPVRVDAEEQYVELLTGEVITRGGQAGSRVVVVDMPAGLGSRVGSVLWTRSLPAVVFAVQRLIYVHPYRHTRWCFLAVTEKSRRHDDPAGLSVPLVDVQVVSDSAVPLPLPRLPSGSGRLRSRPTVGLSWVYPPPIGDVPDRLLPSLTAVLAAICTVVAEERR